MTGTADLLRLRPEGSPTKADVAARNKTRARILWVMIKSGIPFKDFQRAIFFFTSDRVSEETWQNRGATPRTARIASGLEMSSFQANKNLWEICWWFPVL